MSVNFNQQGQTVQTQYNAENIHLGSAAPADYLIQQIQQLSGLVEQLLAEGTLSDSSAATVRISLEQAAVEVQKPVREKATILDRLSKAAEIVKGVTAASGVVEGFNTLVQHVINLLS